MSAPSPKRTFYDDAHEAELDRWPGVASRRAVRGKHNVLILSFGGVERLHFYPSTPSDQRGALNSVTQLRVTLKAMGACREPTRKATGPKRRRNKTDAPTVITERATGGPRRDPWAALQRLTLVEPAPEAVAPPAQPVTVWSRLTAWWRR